MSPSVLAPEAYLARPDYGQWKATTGLQEKVSCGAVRALAHQWADDHDGRPINDRVSRAYGDTVKRLVPANVTNDDAVRVIRASLIVSRAVDLWARAYALAGTDRPLPKDYVLVMRETLELLVDRRDVVKVLHAAELAGTRGKPFVASAYRDVVTGTARSAGVYARAEMVAKVQEAAASAGQPITYREAAQIAHQRRYGLSWVLPPLESPLQAMHRRVVETEERDAERVVEAEALWLTLTTDQQEHFLRHALLNLGLHPSSRSTALPTAKRNALDAHQSGGPMTDEEHTAAHFRTLGARTAPLQIERGTTEPYWADETDEGEDAA